MARQKPQKKITPPQYAEILGVSPSKVIGFIRRGELPAINVATSPGRRPRYLIDPKDIEAFERSRRVIPDGGLSTTQRLRRKAPTQVKEFF